MRRVLAVLGPILVLILLAFLGWFYSRTSPDTGTLGGLLSIEQFVQTKALASASPASSCSTPDSIFSDADIQRGLATVRSSSHVEPVCMSSKGSWAIAAPLHGGLFGAGGLHQFCIDSSGAYYEILGSLASSSCPARYEGSTLRIFVQDTACLPQATYALDVKNGMDPKSIKACPN